MNPKVSIIIPVYNAERYLNRCIDSVLSQTFTDYELLLINDGSTDESGDICDFYGQKDSRIRVFHKENGGVSSARNVGINNARGEWIAFVDADDELFFDAFASLTKEIYSDIDLVMAGYDEFDVHGNMLFSTSSVLAQDKMIDRDLAIKLLYRDKYYQYYVVAKLFRGSIIKDNKIFFNESLFFSEDRLFVIEYLSVCRKKIHYITKPVYRYLLRIGGAMQSLTKSFNKKSLTGFYATLLMCKIIEGLDTTRKNKSLVREDVIQSYNITVSRMREFEIDDKLLMRSLHKKIFTVMSYRQYLFIMFKFKLAYFLRKIVKLRKCY